MLVHSTLLTALGLASSVQAWGGLGHKTVANVALQFLQDEALARVEDILTSDGHKRFPNPSLVDVATWADDFGRSRTGGFSKTFHFLNAQDDPPFSCDVDLARGDCNDDKCVVTAIANYTRQLIATSRNVNDTADALKFLVHFIGDITQPLHTEATARGGTQIDVIWKGNRNKNLHSVWDTDMITALAGSDTPGNMEAWTTTIVNEITDGSYQALIPEWLRCTDINTSLDCALDWAVDSNFFICTHVLATDPAGKDLSGAYYRAARPVIQQQVAKAGIRMAVWFNQLFGSGQPGRLPLARNRLVVQGREL